MYLPLDYGFVEVDDEVARVSGCRDRSRTQHPGLVERISDLVRERTRGQVDAHRTHQVRGPGAQYVVTQLEHAGIGALQRQRLPLVTLLGILIDHGGSDQAVVIGWIQYLDDDIAAGETQSELTRRCLRFGNRRLTRHVAPAHRRADDPVERVLHVGFGLGYRVGGHRISFGIGQAQPNLRRFTRIGKGQGLFAFLRDVKVGDRVIAEFDAIAQRISAHRGQHQVVEIHVGERKLDVPGVGKTDRRVDVDLDADTQCLHRGFDAFGDQVGIGLAQRELQGCRRPADGAQRHALVLAAGFHGDLEQPVAAHRNAAMRGIERGDQRLTRGLVVADGHLHPGGDDRVELKVELVLVADVGPRKIQSKSFETVSRDRRGRVEQQRRPAESETSHVRSGNQQPLRFPAVGRIGGGEHVDGAAGHQVGQVGDGRRLRVTVGKIERVDRRYVGKIQAQQSGYAVEIQERRQRAEPGLAFQRTGEIGVAIDLEDVLVAAAVYRRIGVDVGDRHLVIVDLAPVFIPDVGDQAVVENLGQLVGFFDHQRRGAATTALVQRFDCRGRDPGRRSHRRTGDRGIDHLQFGNVLVQVEDHREAAGDPRRFLVVLHLDLLGRGVGHLDQRAAYGRGRFLVAGADGDVIGVAQHPFAQGFDLQGRPGRRRLLGQLVEVAAIVEQDVEGMRVIGDRADPYRIRGEPELGIDRRLHRRGGGGTIDGHPFGLHHHRQFDRGLQDRGSIFVGPRVVGEYQLEIAARAADHGNPLFFLDAVGQPKLVALAQRAQFQLLDLVGAVAAEHELHRSRHVAEIEYQVVAVGGQHAGIDGQLVEATLVGRQQHLPGDVGQAGIDVITEYQGRRRVGELDGFDRAGAAAGDAVTDRFDIGGDAAHETGGVNGDLGDVALTRLFEMNVEQLVVGAAAAGDFDLEMGQTERAASLGVDRLLDALRGNRGIGVVGNRVGSTCADRQRKRPAGGVLDFQPLLLVSVLPVLQRGHAGGMVQAAGRDDREVGDVAGGRPGEFDAVLARPHRGHVGGNVDMGIVERRLDRRRIGDVIGADRDAGRAERAGRERIVEIEPQRAAVRGAEIEIVYRRIRRITLAHLLGADIPGEPIGIAVQRIEGHIPDVGARRLDEFDVEGAKAGSTHLDRAILAERIVEFGLDAAARRLVPYVAADGDLGGGERNAAAVVVQRQRELGAGKRIADEQGLQLVVAAESLDRQGIATGERPPDVIVAADVGRLVGQRQRAGAGPDFAVGQHQAHRVSDAAEVDGIVALAVGFFQRVLAEAGLEAVDIVIGPALEGVVTGSADQQVVAGTTLQRVAAVTTVEMIFLAATLQRIGLVPADQTILAGTAYQGIPLVPADQPVVACVAVQDIDTIGTDQQVVAAAADVVDAAVGRIKDVAVAAAFGRWRPIDQYPRRTTADDAADLVDTVGIAARDAVGRDQRDVGRRIDLGTIGPEQVVGIDAERRMVALDRKVDRPLVARRAEHRVDSELARAEQRIERCPHIVAHHRGAVGIVDDGIGFQRTEHQPEAAAVGIVDGQQLGLDTGRGQWLVRAKPGDGEIGVMHHRGVLPLEIGVVDQVVAEELAGAVRIRGTADGAGERVGINDLVKIVALPADDVGNAGRVNLVGPALRRRAGEFEFGDDLDLAAAPQLENEIGVDTAEIQRTLRRARGGIVDDEMMFRLRVGRVEIPPSRVEPVEIVAAAAADLLDVVREFQSVGAAGHPDARLPREGGRIVDVDDHAGGDRRDGVVVAGEIEVVAGAAIRPRRLDHHRLAPVVAEGVLVVARTAGEYLSVTAGDEDVVAGTAARLESGQVGQVDFLAAGAGIDTLEVAGRMDFPAHAAEGQRAGVAQLHQRRAIARLLRTIGVMQPELPLVEGRGADRAELRAVENEGVDSVAGINVAADRELLDRGAVMDDGQRTVAVDRVEHVALFFPRGELQVGDRARVEQADAGLVQLDDDVLGRVGADDQPRQAALPRLDDVNRPRDRAAVVALDADFQLRGVAHLAHRDPEIAADGGQVECVDLCP